jgi:hypothetical protein
MNLIEFEENLIGFEEIFNGTKNVSKKKFEKIVFYFNFVLYLYFAKLVKAK